MRFALWLALGVGAMACVWVLGTQLDPIRELSEGKGICLLRRAGVPCPNCGMTRAVAALGRGDLGTALQQHPLALPLLLELAILWSVAGVQLKRLGGVQIPNGQRLATWLSMHAVAWVALWIGRTATGTVPW